MLSSLKEYGIKTMIFQAKVSSNQLKNTRPKEIAYGKLHIFG